MARAPRSPAEIERAIRRIERIAHLLDRQFKLPGTRVRVGVDGILGLIPFAGDLAAAILGLGLVAHAWRIGAPPRVVAPMIGNVSLDAIVGILPFAGDAFDIVFKANTRNALRLRAWWEGEKASGRAQGHGPDAKP